MIDGPAATALLALHAAATLAMVGVIWFVQLVHYPLFDHADRSRFEEFERAHQRRTGRVVVPLMLTELGGATAAAFALAPSALGVTALSGLALLALIWGSTALIQVPCHARLARGWDAATHARLVRGNWLRTAAWSVRGVLALWLVVAG